MLTEQFVIIVDQQNARWITSAAEIKRETVDGADLVVTPKDTWHLTAETYSKVGRPCRSVSVRMARDPEIIVEEWRVPDSNSD